MQGLKALASHRRLRILRLLAAPEAAVNRTDAGVSFTRASTAVGLRKKLGISQPALSEQMQILLDSGLVEAHYVGRFTVYKRDEERIRQLRQTILDQLLPTPEANAGGTNDEAPSPD